MSLSGLIVPTPTLYSADGSIDPGRNAQFARALREAHVDHLFVLGSEGEFPSILDSERPPYLAAVIESLIAPTDAWVGCGAPSTRQAIRFAQEAEAAGAAAVVAVPPYYLHPPLPAVERYYRAIHDAVKIPLLAYNIPSLVGYALPPELVGGLAKDQVIAGAKDTAGSLASIDAFLAHAPAGFPLFPGDDLLAKPAIEHGASGAVMGLANIAPKLCVDLVAATRAQDTARAAQLQELLVELHEVRRLGPFPSTDKFLAHRWRGAAVGYRSPYDALTPQEEEKILLAAGTLPERLKPYF